MSRRRHQSHLPRKLPTENQWKALITDFQTLKLRNSGKVDRFHHMTDTITSENNSTINQHKLHHSSPQRLDARFFWPQKVTISDKLHSPRRPAASTLKSQKRAHRERENKVTEHLVHLFQRKNGMKLFYLFDKERKGYLSRNDLGKVLSEMGYNSLNDENHRNIYQKLTTLSKGDDDRVTFKDLRRIQIDTLCAHSLGSKPVRASHEDALFRHYLDPIKSSKARHGELFFLQTDKERAHQIVDTLQSRYATLDRPLAKLKCWDINKDGRIERDEMKGMLSKMNIAMTDKELDEFFRIFHRNEQKFRSRGPRASYLKQRLDAENEGAEAVEAAKTISYPIFLQTIMKHDFDDDPKDREGDRLLSPPQKKNKPPQIGDIDAESFRILKRLRSAADTKFKSGHLTTDVFRYLDANYDAFVNHEEFRNKLKHIDTKMTPEQANRIIALMDPENAGMIKFGQFAQCFNVPDQERINYNMLRFHRRQRGGKGGRLDLFDTDPKSAMFASNEDRFNRNPFVPKAKSVEAPRHSQKNQSKESYNILHHS